MPRKKKQMEAEQEKAALAFAQAVGAVPPVPQPDPVQQAATDAMSRKATDTDLWRKWDQGGRKPEDLSPLLQRFEGMKQQQLRGRKYGPQVDVNAYGAEVDKRHIQRIGTYNPDKGVALSTWVFPGTRSASRWGNTHANTRAIPEAEMQQIGKLQAARDELNERFGRAPTHEEVAAHSGMPAKRVRKILQAADIKDVPSSAFESDPTPRAQARDVEILAPFYQTLTGDEREVFGHWYGMEGRPTIQSGQELAKKLGKDPSQISNIRSRVFQKYRSHL